jgi:hypothetical protein
VDPVPDPLLFSGSAGNRTRASGSVAKNSDQETTEAVGKNIENKKVVWGKANRALKLPQIWVLR